MPSRYESLVSASRPNDAHGISLQLVGTGKRVLELGAASGHVTAELVARGNSVVAVEIDPSLRSSLETFTDGVIIANLDDLGLCNLLDGEQFDVVLAGDVLEHTINTRLILEEIRCSIRTGGYLVISVPNIAHGDVRLSLLNGEFRYRDVGILDRTHRTFFTRETLTEFLTSNGFHQLEVFASTTPVGTTELKPPIAEIPGPVIDHVLRDPLSSVYQFIVKAYPVVYEAPSLVRDPSPSPADPRIAIFESALASRDATLNRLASDTEAFQAQLHDKDAQLHDKDAQLHDKDAQLHDKDAQLHDKDAQLLEKEAALTEVNDMLHRVEQRTDEIQTSLNDLKDQVTRQGAIEHLELRDYALGVLAELGEARAILLHRDAELRSAHGEISTLTERLAKEMTRAFEAEKRVNQLAARELELNAVYQSFTWKLGRFCMLPIRALRRILGR